MILKLIKSIQNLVELFKLIIALKEANKVKIIPLKNPEKLTIDRTIKLLDKQFNFDYKTSYGSKLPVLAFYAIYTNFNS